jgi:hypothetical protein
MIVVKAVVVAPVRRAEALARHVVPGLSVGHGREAEDSEDDSPKVGGQRHRLFHFYP